jgi:hypothetical protein
MHNIWQTMHLSTRKLLLRKANQYARVAKPWRCQCRRKDALRCRRSYSWSRNTWSHVCPQCWQNSQPIYWTSSFGWCSTRFKLWAPFPKHLCGISNAISISTTSAWLSSANRALEVQASDMISKSCSFSNTSRIICVGILPYNLVRR